MRMVINFALGKNGDHKPSGLDNKSIMHGGQEEMQILNNTST